MHEEREAAKAGEEKAKKQNASLQSLCKTLQEERKKARSGEAPAAKEEEKKEEKKEEAGTKEVDWNADKIARKLAAMPDVDPALDIAAMRAKAQGNKMSDEEKKARGLLYDTSKAKATRESSEEEEEGACDAVEGAFDDY
jgi:hypothetical protein